MKSIVFSNKDEEEAFEKIKNAEWESAEVLLGKLQSTNPSSSIVYVGKLLVYFKEISLENLANSEKNFKSNIYYLKAIKYADSDLKDILENLTNTNSNKEKTINKETTYVEKCEVAKTQNKEKEVRNKNSSLFFLWVIAFVIIIVLINCVVNNSSSSSSFVKDTKWVSSDKSLILEFASRTCYVSALRKSLEYKESGNTVRIYAPNGREFIRLSISGETASDFYTDIKFYKR